MIPPIANRFVAGEHTATALDHAARVNDRGLDVILNLLGEQHTDPARVTADVETYQSLLDDIAGTDIDACISVKPTQLGLEIGPPVFESHLENLVKRARDVGGFVWIDMEGSDTTSTTLAAFERIATTAPGCVGVCLQSNLCRTNDDIHRLSDVPGPIRIVKGAYNEPSGIAYQSKEQVNEAYRRDLELLFRSHDGGVAVATHDPEMIAYATQLATVYDTPFEFQMLMGVAENRQDELADSYPVTQYIPFGSRWFSYFRRRMFERTENLSFAIRAILNQ